MIRFSVVLPMIRWSFGWFCLPMIRWSFWWFCLPMIRWSNFGFFVEYYRRSDDHISVFFAKNYRWSDDHISVFLPKITNDPMITFRFFFFFAFLAEDRVTFDFQSAWLVFAFLGSNRRSSFTNDPMILFWNLFTDEPTIIRPMFYRWFDDHK